MADEFQPPCEKRGKGIRILASAPYKVKEEWDRLDPVTGEVMLDENGMPQKRELQNENRQSNRQQSRTKRREEEI